MRSRTFHIYNLPAELFIEALLEKAYCEGEIREIKIIAHPENERLHVYAKGGMQIKAMVEPEAEHIKITICRNDNDLKRIEELKAELLSLISMRNQEYCVEERRANLPKAKQTLPTFLEGMGNG